jgi:hypothetical protein
MAGQIGMTGHNITRVGDITLEETGAGTDAITIRAPVSITPYTLVLPIDDGDAGEVLSTDGSGVLSWIPPQSGWIRLRRTANQTGYTTGQKITWQASESGGSNPPTFSGPSSTITLPVGTWELVGNLSGQSFSGPTASSQSKWTDGAGTPLGDSTEVYLESRQSTTSSNDNPQNTAIVVVASGTTDVELEATRGSGSHDITGATAWAFIRKIG